ncbi:membrane protein [Candidatus Magnetomorum sp. HK-1]|nr:membrane protein [Candidatus Magnetomorum sp. HK-1]
MPGKTKIGRSHNEEKMSTQLKNCPACNVNINVLVKICPKCGYPEPFIPIYKGEYKTCDLCKGNKTITEYRQIRHHSFQNFTIPCYICRGAKKIIVYDTIIDYEPKCDSNQNLKKIIICPKHGKQLQSYCPLCIKDAKKKSNELKNKIKILEPFEHNYRRESNMSYDYRDKAKELSESFSMGNIIIKCFFIFPFASLIISFILMHLFNIDKIFTIGLIYFGFVYFFIIRQYKESQELLELAEDKSKSAKKMSEQWIKKMKELKIAQVDNKYYDNSVS